MSEQQGEASEQKKQEGAEQKTEEYRDVAAIAALLKILGPLNDEERANVIAFVFRKLDIHWPPGSQGGSVHQGTDLAESLGVTTPPAREVQSHAVDIRSFTDEKKPKTANHMVAVAAYYLEHLAPQSERRTYITADDLAPLFKEAGFPLPKAPPGVTLTHAKNAGYLKALERGQYRLNPMGHQLVAHKVPGGEESTAGTKSRRR